MVSLGAQNVQSAPSRKTENNEQFQPINDNSPVDSSQQIKSTVHQTREQRVDDAIELEQDAARLARNVIGISHKIASQQHGLSRAHLAVTTEANQASAKRIIPKDPVSDRRLNHFQHHQGPEQTAPTRKRALLGEPSKQTTMHRPTGAHAMPASVIVS